MSGGWPATPILLALLAVGGCAATGTWQNADVPQEQWNEDEDACHRLAQQQATRDYALSQESERSLDYARGGRWAGQMNTFSSGQNQGRLFRDCMSRRGYTLQPGGDAGKPESDATKPENDTTKPASDAGG